MRTLLLLGVLVLVVYALVDCVRTRSADVHGLPKVLWLALILLVPGVGALAWLLLGRDRGTAAPPARRSGPVAPDDDPEFLWRLEQERRRKEGGQGSGQSGTTGPEPA